MSSPVGDNALLNGVLEGQDSPLALGLVTHVRVLLVHVHHQVPVPDREHSVGRPLSMKPAFHVLDLLSMISKKSVCPSKEEANEAVAGQEHGAGRAGGASRAMCGSY